MIRIRQVKVPVRDDNLLKGISKKLRIKEEEISSVKVIKKSIDARDKNNIYFVYEVDINTSYEEYLIKRYKDVSKSIDKDYKLEITGKEEIKNRVVIVGSGPAGLTCAYMLASLGYKPLVIEQGEKIEERVKTVEDFFENNKLNELSNIQFGEGGAGTFSDGKLNTLVKDKYGRGKKVFEIFIENGAPEEIMYLNKPHIGTDVLRKVIVNMRNKIITMGGDFRFKTKLTDIIIENNCLKGIIVNGKEEILCDVLILAIGHSARDTFYMLDKRGLNMTSKNFAVGLRIEHPQEMINKSQYGMFYKDLTPASYKLTYKSSTGRGVYSFCMCPGGYVVNASSEEKRLVVNGMSNYKRDGRNANSAIVVTVGKKDFGDNLFGGLEFQRRLEEKAYQLGNGLIPIQLVGDYFSNCKTTKLGSVIPCTKGKYSFSNLNELFPSDITNSLKEGINNFERKIKGFRRDDAILLGVESRTSSPVVIVRDDDFISNIKGIYPCGEGAGYAGGITTSCIDGIKVVESLVKKYHKIK